MKEKRKQKTPEWWRKFYISNRLMYNLSIYIVYHTRSCIKYLLRGWDGKKYTVSAFILVRVKQHTQHYVQTRIRLSFAKNFHFFSYKYFFVAFLCVCDESSRKFLSLSRSANTHAQEWKLRAKKAQKYDEKHAPFVSTYILFTRHIRPSRVSRIVVRKFVIW